MKGMATAMKNYEQIKKLFEERGVENLHLVHSQDEHLATFVHCTPSKSLVDGFGKPISKKALFWGESKYVPGLDPDYAKCFINVPFDD